MDFEWWLRIAHSGVHIQRIPGTWARFRLEAGTKSVSAPSVFWEENIPLISRYIVNDPLLATEVKESILKRAHYQAGLGCLHRHDLHLDRAKSYLQRAFSGGIAPYNEMAELAEDLVGRSGGKMGRNSPQERQEYLERFFDAAPRCAATGALSAHVAMVLAFHEYYAGSPREAGQLARRALLQSPALLRNIGLLKLALVRPLDKSSGSA
jgi:hypothetical protein